MLLDRTAIVVVNGGKIQYVTFMDQPAVGALSQKIPDTYNNGAFDTYGVACSSNTSGILSEPAGGLFACDTSKNGNDCTCEVRVYLAWVGTDFNGKTMRSLSKKMKREENAKIFHLSLLSHSPVNRNGYLEIFICKFCFENDLTLPSLTFPLS
jgi:hypothetical protein